MKILTFKDENGIYRVYKELDQEFKNPIEIYRNALIIIQATEAKDMFFLKNPKLKGMVPDSFFKDKAEAKWIDRYNEIFDAKIHDNFISLIKNNSKKSEQIRLLKGASLNPLSLTKLIFKGYLEFGYSYSVNHSEHHHKGLDESKLPNLIHQQRETIIKTVGETSLTDGELKNVIEHRKVITSRFIDNGDNWHCFFGSYRSIYGEEKAWKDGQPHIHYISDKWGIPREEIVTGFKDGNCPTTSVHIDLLEYRKSWR